MGNRILATLIDTLLTFLIIFALALICLAADYLVSLTLNNSPLLKPILISVIALIFVFSTFVVNFGYFIFFEGLWRGQTPGKKFASIRVVEQNGQPVSWSSVWIRNLLRIFDEGFFIVGLLFMIIDKNERRLGDFAANTIVIRERIPQISTGDLKLTATLTGDEHWDAGHLTPQEYELLVAFLKRRQDFDATHRSKLANRLKEYFASKAYVNNNSGNTAPEPYLERLFLAYQARAEV